MSDAPVFVVSDIHLGAVPPARERAFVRWLEHTGGEASELIINGDLFDFWFEYEWAIPRGHTRVLAALAALVDGGVPVRFFGGNHDWWGGSFLEEEIGLVLHREPAVLDVAGRRAFVAHGDGLGRGDLGYRILKRTLRSRFTRWSFRWLHPDLGARLARSVSGTGRRLDDATESAQRRARILEAWATEKMCAEPELDLVLLGHAHVPQILEVEDGRFYVNAGDWVDHRSYVVLAWGESPRLLEWEPS